MHALSRKLKNFIKSVTPHRAAQAMSETVTCYCGAVKITVTGEPQVTPLCHCADCRRWNGGVGQAARLYAPDQVKIDGEIFGIEFDGK